MITLTVSFYAQSLFEIQAETTIVSTLFTNNYLFTRLYAKKTNKVLHSHQDVVFMRFATPSESPARNFQIILPWTVGNTDYTIHCTPPKYSLLGASKAS